jgi:N-acyl-D-amino-acid deacylase
MHTTVKIIPLQEVKAENIMECDLLIKNGFIIDGTGRPGFYGNLAVSNGKILGLAPSLDCNAKRTIDATGLTVSPGFIDPHVHGELVVLSKNKFEEFLRQGVTTAINGNCGHSITPYASGNIYEYMTQKGLISPRDKESYQQNLPVWDNFSGYLDIIKTIGMSINMGFLLGHGTLRWSVMGNSNKKAPTADEEKQIHRFVEEGMEQGALGISTGLAYTPSKYAETSELIKLAAIVQKYKGIYASHLRTYIGFEEAVKEAISIGEAANIRVQISHLTPTCPQAYEEILSARRRGVEVAVDIIPKSSGHFKSKDKLLQFIAAAAAKPLNPNMLSSQEAFAAPPGLHKLLKRIRFKEQLIVINTEDPKMEKQMLKDIAAEKNVDVNHLLSQLLVDNNPKLTFCQGGLNRWDFPGLPFPDNIMNNPYVMVGSDKIFGDTANPADWYELFRNGAFPIYFDLCQGKGLKLEEVIRRVTSLPAQHFRLTNRGLLAVGKAADITIFNPADYSYPSNEEIDFYNPLNMAKGVNYTIVNGQVILDKGILNDITAGQVLFNDGR